MWRVTAQYNCQRFSHFPLRLTVKHLFREVRLEYLLAFHTLHSTFLKLLSS